MKYLQLILLIIINLFINLANATTYERLHLMYEAGQHQEALRRAKTYLELHPNDGDVRLALAQFYFAEKKYQQARKELLIILEQTPNYTDALLVLINCDIELSSYKEASFLADYGLLLHPVDLDLYKKRSDIEALEKTTQMPYRIGIKPQPLKILNLSNLPALPPKYKELKTLYYVKRKHQLAILQAIDYLKLHPSDSDVRLVLGQFYFNQKNYLMAQKQMKLVLKNAPKYKDAMLILINIAIKLKQYSTATAIARQGLSYYPKDSMFIKKIDDIKNSQSLPQRQIQLAKPQTQEINYSNEIGLYQQNYSMSDVHQIWNYSTLYYAREGKFGRIYAKVNYNQRLGFRATQEEIEAFPKLNKYIYFELQAAIANEPNLFPDRLYGGEMYVSVPSFLDFSGGGKYNLINSLHQFTLYTGSVSKQFDKHRITYRLNNYHPNRGAASLLTLLDYRYMVHDPYFYVGVIYGRGTSPDLADLATVDFLITDNQIISPYFNFPLFNNRLNIYTSFYYQHQTFPSSSLIRNWAGGTLRLSWKY